MAEQIHTANTAPNIAPELGGLALGAEAEPQTRLGALNAELNEFAAKLDVTGLSQTELRTLRYESRTIVVWNSMDEILQEGKYSAAELHSLFATLHNIDTTLGGPATAWEHIEHAAGSDAMAELSAQEGTVLDNVIKNGMRTTYWRTNSLTYKKIVRAADAATAGRFKGMQFWRKDGKAAETNDYVKDLASDPAFPDTIVSISAKRIDEDPKAAPLQKMVAYRQVERYFFKEVLGLSPQLSRMIRFAIDSRTRAEDKGKIIPLSSPKGGVDMEKWKTTMQAMANAANRIGAENLERMHERAGLVNFDRYTIDQLHRMHLFTLETPRDQAEHDERAALFAKLRNKDVRLVLSDAYGDHNGALDNLGTTLETDNETALFFEVRKPEDIYRHLALVRHMDVRPASIVFAAHGGIGLIKVGEGKGAFTVVGESDPQKKRKKNERPEYALKDLRIDRIFRDFMQVSRVTGEREIILLSCLQANTGAQNAPVTPTAVRLAEASHPDDKVVVYAADTTTNISKTTTGDMMFLQPNPADPDNHLANTPLDATAYRVEGRMVRSRGGGRQLKKIITREKVTTIPRI
ncbi:MAG TPA: hypothetical protein VF466_04180 [Candidatus Saccharimonadales bacterium]